MDKQIVLYAYNTTQIKRKLLIYTIYLSISKPYTEQNKEDTKRVYNV